ncbi:CPBP family glutamic-type intramembrane protease [Saccharothrix isguenensis]
MTRPTFDRTACRVPPDRLLAATCVLAFAVAQWQVEWSPVPGVARAIGVLLAVETILLCLPWSLPRDERAPAGFVAESAAGLLVPVGAVVLLAVAGAPELFAGADLWWYPVGAAFGVVLVLLGGLDVRGLLDGSLAFLLGPTPRPHGVSRAVCSLAGPPGEEAVFRGVVLVASAGAALPLAMIGAVAFVARHRVQPGANGRATSRAFLVEVAAAVGFLAITVWSGSLWPALLGHLLNNLPAFLLQLQRAVPERTVA